VVQTAQDYAAWLARNGGSDTLADEGRALFIRYGCSGCHEGNSSVRTPSLRGLYGSPVPLADGSVATADERYLHDAITQPAAQVPAGYERLMPSFAGRISEEDLVKLIAYIRGLAASP
jgi:cytochrome c oxidase subunit 2